MTRLEKFLKQMGWGSHSSRKSKRICLDVGSHTTKICVDGRVLPYQPTCFLQHKTTGSILVVGERAGKMLGKLPNDILPIFPVRLGKITDTEAYSQFVNILLQPFVKGGLWTFFQPTHLQAVELFPEQLTQRRALFSGLRQVSRHVTLFSMADVLWDRVVSEGIFTREGCIIDIGGMTTKIYLFAEGQLSVGQVYQFGGDSWTEEVMQTLRRQYHLEVGWLTGEQFKQKVLHFGGPQHKHTIQGKDIISGLPTTKVVTEDVFEAGSRALVARLIQSFQEVCQAASPELITRILERGVYLTGGGSQIPGFGLVLEEALKLPIITANQPQEDVVRGLLVGRT